MPEILNNQSERVQLFPSANQQADLGEAGTGSLNVYVGGGVKAGQVQATLNGKPGRVDPFAQAVASLGDLDGCTPSAFGPSPRHSVLLKGVMAFALPGAIFVSPCGVAM